MKVIARFQNTTNVTGPYTGESQTLNVKINTEQSDGTGGMVVTDSKFTGSIYRNNTSLIYNNVNLKGYVYANSTGSMGPSDSFETVEECLAKYSSQGTYFCQTAENVLGSYTTDASTLNKTYYLKHDVVDDIITASYVCFVYNNSEHCMKGADGGASFAANTQTIQDYQTFYNLNTVYNASSSNPGCYLGSSGSSHCYGGGFDRVGAGSNGGVGVYGSSSGGCDVNSDGNSICSR